MFGTPDVGLKGILASTAYVTELAVEVTPGGGSICSSLLLLELLLVRLALQMSLVGLENWRALSGG